MEVPGDIHEFVLGLATDMVNASATGDTRAKWRLYGELRDYCESTSAAGRDHPFLWETLADFTTDDSVAVHIYLRALDLAMGFCASEFEASIRFALAQRHADMGAALIAYDYAAQANELAMHTNDIDLRREISQFLLDHSGASVGT